MKNTMKCFGIIALALTIGFSFVGCDNGSGGGVLAAPTGLTATAVSSTQINLTWNSVAGAAGYNVYGSLSPSSGFLSDPAYTNSMIAYNAIPGTTYYFKVAAFSANGTEGAMSNTVLATTPSGGTGVPAAPTGLTATASGSTLNVFWNAVAGATEYTLYVSVNASFSPFETARTLLPGYTEYNVPAGTYYFRVSATNASGEGAMSNTVSTTVGGSTTPTYSLDGVWEMNGMGGLLVTVNGSTGVWSAFGTKLPALWQNAVDKGHIKLGGQRWRNITSTGTLTWSGQQVNVTYSTPNVSSGTTWHDCTFTLSNNGQTLTVQGGDTNNPSGSPVTWTRW